MGREVSVVQQEFCRERSAGASMVGTAAQRVRTWVLIEDQGPWGPKAPKDRGATDPVRAALTAVDKLDNARLQLIRRPRSIVDAELRRVILIEAGEGQGRGIELDVPTSALADLDVAELLAHGPGVTPGGLEVRSLSGPILLVCTHGTRDRCCAKWGIPIFEALSAYDPDRVWQATHLGGHRFAANVLSLPRGLLWGRVELSDTDALWSGSAEDRLWSLEHLRGRCCHARPIQAAEVLLRRALGIRGPDALRLVEWSQTGAATEATFDRLEGGRIQVALRSRSLGLHLPMSCGDAPSGASGWEIEILPGA